MAVGFIAGPLGLSGAGTFGAAIVPAIAIGFNWKRATAEACVSSILVSLAFNLGLELLNRHGIYSLPNGLLTSTLSVMVSIIIFVVVSLLGGDSGRKALPPRHRGSDGCLMKEMPQSPAAAFYLQVARITASFLASSSTVESVLVHRSVATRRSIVWTK